MGAIEVESDPLLGTSVGRYRISRVVGQGGMGRVYEGIDPAIGSRVAIKVIAEAYARDATLAERFFAEARAVNMIRHENIVNVLEYSRLPDGRPLIIMEYIDGRTLREVLATGPAPLGGITVVMLETLSALTAAHTIGIVHRDLKPDNIVLTRGGRVKVLDFGIAKLLKVHDDNPAPRTRTGMVLGTPEYMSPEHINGGVTDERSDVYSMGVVLFEAVTGRRPFEGASDFDVMRAQVEKRPPRPRALRAGVPEAFEEVMLVSLAKHPRDRYETANAMAVALHAASAALPSHEWRALIGTGPVARPSQPPIQLRDTTDTKLMTHFPVDDDMLETVRSGETSRPLHVVDKGRLDVGTAVVSVRSRPPSPAPSNAGRLDVSTALVASAPRAAKTRSDAPPRAAIPEPAPRRRRWPILLGIVGVAIIAVGAFVLGQMTASSPGSTAAPPAPVVMPSQAEPGGSNELPRPATSPPQAVAEPAPAPAPTAAPPDAPATSAAPVTPVTPGSELTAPPVAKTKPTTVKRPRPKPPEVVRPVDAPPQGRVRVAVHGADRWDVTVDGVAMGKIDLVPLSVGTHTVIVKLPNRDAKTWRLDIKPGQTETIDVYGDKGLLEPGSTTPKKVGP